jgi:toxin ParE1/3/4
MWCEQSSERPGELETFPNGGRPGRMHNTRELALVPLPFIIVYRVFPQAVQIIRIVHGAQCWL